MTTTIKPVLKYVGAKWSIAQWVVSHLPPHIHYVEPFFGSGAIFFNKIPAKHEVINDLDGSVVNLFRMVRERGAELAALIELTPWAREEYELSYQPCDDAMERARRFLVRAWQAHGGRLDSRSGWFSQGTDQAGTSLRWQKLPDRIGAVISRIRDAEIEHRPALDVIARMSATDVLIYADPPYPISTRSGKMYQYEMTDADHIALLDTLDAHPGPVVLSGYVCPLYDNRLSGWHRVTKTAQADQGRARTEVLWLNDKAQPVQARLL